MQQNDRRTPLVTITIREPKNRFKASARIRSMSRRRQKIALVRWIRKGLQTAMFAPFHGKENVAASEIIGSVQAYTMKIIQPITFTIDIVR
jgi:hypothetical protein